MPFKALSTGGACADVSTCTAINIRTLPWDIHGYKEYYVIIKATNVVGSFTLASSDAYIHAVDLASEGVVFDIDKGSGFLVSVKFRQGFFSIIVIHCINISYSYS